MNLAVHVPGELHRGDGARALLIGGLLLILAGVLFGDIFAVFILHPNADQIISRLAEAARAVASGEREAAAGAIAAMGGLLENRGTKVDAHVHAITLGYLAVVLALLQPWVAWSRRTRAGLAWCFLAAACIMPPSIFLIHYIGLAYSPFQSIGWASLSADLSGLVVILVVLVELVGLLRSFFARGEADERKAMVLPDLPESRVLSGFGLMMLLVGFLYGVIHAGLYTGRYETRERVRLEEIVTYSGKGEMAAVETALSDYGMLQGERGTRIAAHAHVNEFGLLALLLAFLQPHVFLESHWRRRWVAVFLTGGLVLPVAVASEMRFGLIAGGVADVAGLLIFMSVFAMLIGIVRETGRQDAGAGEVA